MQLLEFFFSFFGNFTEQEISKGGGGGKNQKQLRFKHIYR